MPTATTAVVYGCVSILCRSHFSRDAAESRTAPAASAAESRACPYKSCAAPAAWFAMPSTWLLLSPVTRPNPSSTLPPMFLAVPAIRLSSMADPLLDALEVADRWAETSDNVSVIDLATPRLCEERRQRDNVPRLTASRVNAGTLHWLEIANASPCSLSPLSNRNTMRRHEVGAAMARI
jgi:hypothetical protein